MYGELAPRLGARDVVVKCFGEHHLVFRILGHLYLYFYGEDTRILFERLNFSRPTSWWHASRSREFEEHLHLVRFG